MSESIRQNGVKVKHLTKFEWRTPHKNVIVCKHLDECQQMANEKCHSREEIGNILSTKKAIKIEFKNNEF